MAGNTEVDRASPWSGLITAAELAGMIQAGDPVSILECWRLANLTGMRPTYRVTCRGATVSLEDELSDHMIAGQPAPAPSGVCSSMPADVESDTMCRSAHDD